MHVDGRPGGGLKEDGGVGFDLPIQLLSSHTHHLQFYFFFKVHAEQLPHKAKDLGSGPHRSSGFLALSLQPSLLPRFVRPCTCSAAAAAAARWASARGRPCCPSFPGLCFLLFFILWDGYCSILACGLEIYVKMMTFFFFWNVLLLMSLGNVVVGWAYFFYKFDYIPVWKCWSLFFLADKILISKWKNEDL